jgi:predicted 3-demethylubiquinone-9 3-methyltransferase (glyoxalase superfamily)
MNHYVSIFPDSKILNVMRYGDTGPGPKGTVMTATFQLAEQEFMAPNGGPEFQFTEAISLFVKRERQEEVDCAAGSRISTVCPGRSFPPPWVRCCRIPIQRNRTESCKPCSR